MHEHRGMTLVETAVIVATLAAGAALTAQGVADAARQNRELKDSLCLRQIHSALLVKAADNPGLNLPLPSEINRVGRIAGRGRSDELKNDHASLYSACIAINLISPALPVSPCETSPHVAVCSNYDFEKYDPAKDTFWDGDVPNPDGPQACSGNSHFRADLSTACNTSYAALSLLPTAKGAAFPGRRDAQWWTSGNDQFVLFSNRGPRDGATTGPAFEQSLSVGMLGPTAEVPKAWHGNLAFADNHVERSKGFELAPKTPKAMSERLRKAKPAPAKDNLFLRDDTTDDSDMLLTVTKSVSGTLDGETWKVDARHSWD